MYDIIQVQTKEMKTKTMKLICIDDMKYNELDNVLPYNFLDVVEEVYLVSALEKTALSFYVSIYVEDNEIRYKVDISYNTDTCDETIRCVYSSKTKRFTIYSLETCDSDMFYQRENVTLLGNYLHYEAAEKTTLYDFTYD